MTEQDQKQLGTPLWDIAEQLRGAMNADDVAGFEQQMRCKMHFALDDVDGIASFILAQVQG
jgi:hypothetical protein